ncbi:MAG: hypothetical protein DMF43_09540 [Verrucomicrobia bacterium]|nr:MAG: hypothetical protein DMF43_09540 [Verrucomicrobiota bacterium]
MSMPIQHPAKPNDLGGIKRTMKSNIPWIIALVEAMVILGHLFELGSEYEVFFARVKGFIIGCTPLVLFTVALVKVVKINRIGPVFPR